MTVAQIEAEAEKAEERARELEAWVADFNLRRKDLDPTQNTVYRENFVAATKKIYEDVSLQSKRKEQTFNMLGIFDAANNAVRVESQRRVKLAKKLQLSEIRKKASKLEPRPKTAGEDDSDAFQDGTQRHALAASLFREAICTGPPRMTARQRAQQAATIHRQRQLVGYQIMGAVGRMNPQISEEVLQQYVQPLSSMRRLQRIKTSMTPRSVTREASRNNAAQAGRKPWQQSGEEDGENVMESQNFEIDKDAPTPGDVEEIDDRFLAKRSEIRLRSKEKMEQLKENVKQVDQQMTPLVTHAKQQEVKQVRKRVRHVQFT